MKIDFKALSINTKEEFVDYFIYYHEYVFLELKTEVPNAKEMLLKIVSNAPYSDFEKLWYHTYFTFDLMLIKQIPLPYLKETIKKIIKTIPVASDYLLEQQLYEIQEILDNLDITALYPRPYEQFQQKFSNDAYWMNVQKQLIELFDNNLSLFSESKINKEKYISLKKSKYIDMTTSLYELYGSVIFNCITILKQNDVNIEELIGNDLKVFINTFKKGKFNQEFYQELLNISIDLSKIAIKFI